MDGGDAFDTLVPIRPYQKGSGADDRRTKARSFRPQMPSKNIKVEHVQFAAGAASSSAEAMLKDAYRKQERQDVKREGFVPTRNQGVSLPSDFKGGAAPRRMKARVDGKSADLMDLAFSGSARKSTADGQWRSNYAPISVPYFDVKPQEDAVAETVDERAPAQLTGKSRPKMMQVDEANANAAKQLFLDEEGGLVEGQIIFIQLPAVLPELVDGEEEVHRDGDADAKQTLNRLPDGVLGKLRIHKSGKVKLDIAGVPFCVDQGCDTYFQQELVCVCPTANELVHLGPITKRMVVTPDVDEMLQHSTGEAASM